MSNNTVFRKSSIDRVSSPEQLNDYIKVSRPGVWLILTAVVILLIGLCTWGVLGTLTTTSDAVTVVHDGKGICYVSTEAAKDLTPGMEVRVCDGTGNITSVASEPVEVTADFSAYTLYLGDLKVGDWVVPVTVKTSAPDGTYIAKIVLEAISPISFVLN